MNAESDLVLVTSGSFQPHALINTQLQLGDTHVHNRFNGFTCFEASKTFETVVNRGHAFTQLKLGVNEKPLSNLLSVLIHTTRVL